MAETCREILAQGERAGMPYALSIPREAGAAAAGTRVGTRVGTSLDFRDFRDYAPGDDLRRIDWRIYARSDRLTVKLYQEEVCPHLDLILDTSASMALEESDKRRCTLGLAAALAVAAANGGCTFTCRLPGTPRERLENDSLLPSAWPDIPLDGVASPADHLLGHPPPFRRNAIRILLSDLMWPADPVPIVRLLGEHAGAAAVIRILAEREAAPPEHGNMRLVDVETRETLDVFVDSTSRRRYMRALADHTAGWQDACRGAGVRFVSLTAEDITRGWDLGELARAGILEVA